MEERAILTAVAFAHVIDTSLPWPPYAFPITRLPTRSLEKLVIRAIQMAQVWDGYQTAPAPKIARCLQLPRDTIHWIRIFRSRWLAVQLEDGRLEFWDTESPFGSSCQVCLTGISGLINGMRALNEDTKADLLVLSTK